MKTSDEILLFLVKNSVPQYYIYPVDQIDDSNNLSKKKSKKKILEEILLRVSGTTRYLCETHRLEKFLEEKVSFEKHLRPLFEAGILFFSGVPKKGDFYDSESYRKIFDGSTGQVRDYKNKIDYICFHYRENDFLKDYQNIKNNAHDLKLL